MGLLIDLTAVAANWRALKSRSGAARAAAVVKADAYGLGADRVGPVLYEAGARDFFVALASEGRALRGHLPGDARIFILSGHMAHEDMTGLIPCLNSPEQYFRDRATRPGQPFAIQLDTGMNRLGMEPADWAGIRAEVLAEGPALIMSHLACADEPDHPANAQQLAAFHAMTDGCGVPRSLAATGGILLGPDYHFDLTRPGVGLYGGLPFAEAAPTVRLSLPVIQTRRIEPGESVGYGYSFTTQRSMRIATIAAGYADGLKRALGSGRVSLYAGDVACPLVGRVSMDLMTVDVTHLAEVPEALEIIGPHQGVDMVAEQARTIGYEILTSLGRRYPRSYR